MEFKDLIGERKLSGVALTYTTIKSGSLEDEAQQVLFVLDGITYAVTEDPDDGYRSFMDNIQIYTGDVNLTTFPPVTVICSIKEELLEDNMSRPESSNILVIADKATNSPVLSVGTANTDDYYPYTVCEYTPQNMVFNRLLNTTLYQ